MFENKSYFKIRTATERSFGITLTIFFTILGLFPLLYEENVRLWACMIAVIFLFLSILLPKALIVPNKLWFKLGMLIGAIVAPIIMGIIFFLTVTPTGIIMRLIRKDVFNQQIINSKKSSWIKRKESLDSMKNQF